QFEAFDGYHRRFRQWQWYRPNMETEAQRLDDHPVVEVTAYQGDMLVIWLTGHGAFGTFRLPFQEDWEACARAGRDGETDEFGIPWCDEQQRPILNGKGQEQFDSMSSHGANFDGKRPYGQAKKGPHLNGTVPVGRYPANGLAVVDCHGQVGECMQNLCHTRDRSIKGVDKDYTFSRCWVGAEWHADAQYIRSSYWNYNMYERNHRDGLRLSRTK
ncbi:MAG: SUMF1/EgtB/PvdO family nonheme iron enzyme, partial [Planctomyces sp.]